MSLFDRLGGAPALDVVVTTFYAKIVANDTLKGYFTTTDMVKLKTNQIAFFTKAFGGPDNYQGKDLKAVHTGMGLTTAHWDLAISLLAASLKEHGVSDELIGEVAQAAAPAKGGVVSA